MKKIFTLAVSLVCMLLSVFLCCCSEAQADSGKTDPDSDIETNPETCMHEFGAWYVTEQPTCSKEGKQVRECKKCGKEESEPLAKSEHEYRKTVLKEPTCEEDGLKESHCLREGCTEKKEEKMQKLEHKYTDTVTQQADCTHPGEMSRVCTRPECGKTTVEEIPALGHNWSAPSPSKAPTCTEKGFSSSATCARCGITEENVELPALGHSFQYTDESEYATCLTPGKNVKRCTRCDAKEEETVPALGHDLTDFIQREPTCQNSGKKIVYCRRSNCDYEETVTMEKVDHDFTITHWIKKPTCTEGGQKKLSCRFSCWTETEPIDVPATGHDWQEQTLIRRPTCSEEGKISRTCLTCGKEEEYALDKISHEYTDFVVDTPATEKSEGKLSKRCIYCGSVGEEKTIQKIAAETEFEVRLRRTNGLEFSPDAEEKNYQNLKYEFYRGERLLTTVNTAGDKTVCKVSKEADSLKVVGLPKGYTSVEEKYSVSAGSPIVTVEVKGGIIQGERSVENGKNVTKKPDPLLEVGDFMYDLYISNTMDHSKDGWLSDIMKDKKLVFLDFFHVHCGWCTIHMKQFILAYERTLHKYKDDILVLMLDVMSDEGDVTINNYRSNEHIPEDFVTASCSFESVLVTRWFKKFVPTPGHIWLDNEGMIFYYKVTQTQEDFTNFVESYFARLEKAETEKKALSAAQQSADSLLPDGSQEPPKEITLFDPAFYKRRLFA